MLYGESLNVSNAVKCCEDLLMGSLSSFKLGIGLYLCDWWKHVNALYCGEHGFSANVSPEKRTWSRRTAEFSDLIVQKL